MPTVIIVRSKQELLSISFIYALAKRMKTLDLSRIGATDYLAKIIYSYRGEIRTPEGELIELDDELGYGLDESWNSEIKKKANNPPKRRPKATLYRRLALWCALFIIMGDPIELDDAD